MEQDFTSGGLKIYYFLPFTITIESEIDVTTNDQVWWLILRICALHSTHPKCTHSSENTHTVNTHPEQWADIYAAAPGEQCLVQGQLSRGIEGGESAGHSLPHLQFLPDRDSNSQPFDYESNSPTIRQRPLPIETEIENILHSAGQKWSHLSFNPHTRLWQKLHYLFNIHICN